MYHWYHTKVNLWFPNSKISPSFIVTKFSTGKSGEKACNIPKVLAFPTIFTVGNVLITSFNPLEWSGSTWFITM